MKKKELEQKMQELGVIKKYYSKERKKGFDYYIDEEKFLIYGVLEENHKYVVFLKDFEREKFKETGEFNSEDEAYDYLMELIKK